MKLSEMNLENEGKLVSDGIFDIFALLSTSSIGRVLSFFEDERFANQLNNPDISCLICKCEFIDDVRRVKPGIGIIASNQPRRLFWHLFEKYDIKRELNDKSQIGVNCRISSMASIADRDVIIGDNVTIEEFASIKEGVRIGDNCVIRTGAIIGTVGLQAIRENEGVHLIGHHGHVLIGDDVVINDQTVIECSIFGWDDTIVGDGSVIDKRSIVAHCCKLGKGCMIGADTIICGSTKVGNNVRTGPGVIIKHQLSIGDDSEIIMGTILRKDMGKNEVAINNSVMGRDKFNAIR